MAPGAPARREAHAELAAHADAAAWSMDAVEALFRLAPIGLALIDGEMRYVRVNETLARMHGLTAAEHAGTVVHKLRPGATGEEIERVVGEVLHTGRPQFGVRIHGPSAREEDTEPRHFVGSYLPIHDGRAHVGVLALVQDETDRWQAERERGRLLRMAHAAAARTQTLQAVTEALNEALSADQVARRIVAETRRATGAVAGLVAVVGDAGLMMLHDVGYEGGRWSSELPLHLDTPLGEAVRDKRLILLRSAQERRRYADAPDAGLEAGAFVPLLYEGEAVGAMALGFSAPGDFDEEERAFLLAVGRQCAQALARARLYEQTTFISQRLQRQLLPQRMPNVEWLEVASSYRALGEGTEVGGDFYDLMPAGDGWAALIGDVQGKGIDAAGVAGAARHIIRGLARAVGEPGLIVQGANEALVADLDVDRFVTLALVLFERTGAGVLARIACAGHPAPLVLRNDGTVERVDEAGLIIGVDLEARYEESRVDLAKGEALVLYTDGIVEARRGSEAFGEQRVEAAVRAAQGGTAEEILQTLNAAVMAFEGGQARDDQAVMVLRAR